MNANSLPALLLSLFASLSSPSNEHPSSLPLLPCPCPSPRRPIYPRNGGGGCNRIGEAGVPESLSRKMALLGPIPIPPMSPPGIALLGGLRPQSCVHGKKWQKPVVSVWAILCKEGQTHWDANGDPATQDPVHSCLVRCHQSHQTMRCNNQCQCFRELQRKERKIKTRNLINVMLQTRKAIDKNAGKMISLWS